MKIHFSPLPSNFFLSGSRTWAYAIHPKALRWQIEGLFPLQASSGILSQTLLVGHLFKIYIVIATNSTQNSLGSCLNCSMHLTISIIVLFFLLATLFCWQVYLVISWCWIPCCSKKSINARYSWTLSVLKILILQPLWFSTYALKIWH